MRLAICVAVAATGSAYANNIYKWTDDAGNVHYGDKPAEDTDAKIVDIKSKPTERTQLASIATPSNDPRRQAPLVAPGPAETAPAKPEGPTPEELRALAAERAQKCTKYKERLQTFVQSRRLYRQDENGERVYLNDDEMAETREKTQGKVEEYCTP
ncbi:MAG: DUF4124 domain-containing protein [Woeseia sp.]